MYVKTKSQVFSLSPSFTIWAQWSLPWSSLNMPVTSGEKNIHWWKSLVIQYVKAVSISAYKCIRIFRKSANLIFLNIQFAEPKPDQLRQTPVTALPTQACPAGTRHPPLDPAWLDPAITLEQGKSGLIRPHDLLPQSPVFMIPATCSPFF